MHSHGLLLLDRRELQLHMAERGIFVFTGISLLPGHAYELLLTPGGSGPFTPYLPDSSDEAGSDSITLIGPCEGDLDHNGFVNGVDLAMLLAAWGTGNDEADLDGSGNAGTNNLQGNAGNNSLQGLAGVDTINGNDGDDVIVGGEGNDLLRGGLGADAFVVTAPASGALETDQVYDFSAAEGDIIDLSGVFAGTIALVSAFGKHAGEMTLGFAGGVTTLKLDLNGDGKVDYQMRINGDVTGESGDWLL